MREGDADNSNFNYNTFLSSNNLVGSNFVHGNVPSFHFQNGILDKHLLSNNGFRNLTQDFLQSNRNFVRNKHFDDVKVSARNLRDIRHHHFFVKGFLRQNVRNPASFYLNCLDRNFANLNFQNLKATNFRDATCVRDLATQNFHQDFCGNSFNLSKLYLNYVNGSYLNLS